MKGESRRAVYRRSPRRVDKWLLRERERLLQRYIEALERLTKVLETCRDYTQAILYAERRLRHEPLHEGTYRCSGGCTTPAATGRVREWTRLTTLWRAAEWGRAPFVLVTGEPGMGKTQLIEEFRLWCAHRGAVMADARSYPAEGTLAYGPVMGWLRSTALAPRDARREGARLTELARLLLSASRKRLTSLALSRCLRVTSVSSTPSPA